MANSLDEVTGPVNDAGRDVHVIDKQLPVEVGFGSTLFQIALWVVGPVLVLLFVLLLGSTMTNPFACRCCRLSGGNPSRCYLYLYEDISSQLFPEIRTAYSG